MQKAERKRKIFRGLLLTTLAGVFGFLCWLTWDNLSQNACLLHRRGRMRVGVEEDKARLILWNPLGNPGNAGLGNLEGARLERPERHEYDYRSLTTTSVERICIFPSGTVDLSAPTSMKSVNSLLNDRGPSFSADGKFLISPLIGKEGREDTTYAARRQGEGWSSPEPLGLDANRLAMNEGHPFRRMAPPLLL